MSLSQSCLSACINPLNCILVESSFKDIDRAFVQLVKIAENIPRTRVLQYRNNYWKGVCRSLIFRFPDDLEILKFKGIIQIKSASRVGGSDFGVNSRRVGYLLKELEILNG